jgi:hypothetical protein
MFDIKIKYMAYQFSKKFTSEQSVLCSWDFDVMQF